MNEWVTTGGAPFEYRVLGRGGECVVLHARSVVTGSTVALRCKPIPSVHDAYYEHFPSLLGFQVAAQCSTSVCASAEQMRKHFTRKGVNVSLSRKFVLVSGWEAMDRTVLQYVRHVHRLGHSAESTWWFQFLSAFLTMMKGAQSRVAGFRHGDLRPDNVMLRQNNEMVMIDFDSATVLDPPDEYYDVHYFLNVLTTHYLPNFYDSAPEDVVLIVSGWLPTRGRAMHRLVKDYRLLGDHKRLCLDAFIRQIPTQK